jgi:hypothetical protein
LKEARVNIDLTTKAMLGHWDVTPDLSQCEYQFGRRLIYVQHPKDKPWQPYIEAAQTQVESAWADIAAAVAVAEQLSRSVIPEFWEVHDRSGRPGARLDAYSLHFGYPDSRPIFYIARNHDFEYSYIRYDECDLRQDSPITEDLPTLPDRFFIEVRRLGPGVFESVT